MKRSLLLITATVGPASLVPLTPAAALDLLSAGWNFSPSTPGACPNPGVDYNCYEGRTATDITLVGSNNSSGADTTTFSYALPGSAITQTLSYNYEFDTASTQAVGYYQINTNPRVLFGTPGGSATGSIANFALNPGDTLTFGIDQNGDATFAGTLAITSFSSPNLQPTLQDVPAPLPLFGAALAFRHSRRLRRRRRRDIQR